MLNKLVLYNTLLKGMESHNYGKEILEYVDNYDAVCPARIANDYDEIKEAMWSKGISPHVDAICSIESGSPFYGTILETDNAAIPVIFYKMANEVAVIYSIGESIKSCFLSKANFDEYESVSSKYINETFSREDYVLLDENRYKKITEHFKIDYEQNLPVDFYLSDKMVTKGKEIGFTDINESQNLKPIVSINEDYRPLMFMDPTNTYISENALLKNKLFSHMNKYKEFIVQENVKTSARLAIRTARVAKNKVKSGVVKGVTTATKVPKGILKRIADLSTRTRRCVGDMRNAHDEKLKERLFNDEFIPIFDDLFAYIIPAIGTYGVIVGTAVNPLVAVAMGLLTHVILKYKADADKKRVVALLDDKIELLKEEIEDAKVENDLTTKKQLMQLKMQLERKRSKIKIYGDVGVMA